MILRIILLTIFGISTNGFSQEVIPTTNKIVVYAIKANLAKSLTLPHEGLQPKLDQLTPLTLKIQGDQQKPQNLPTKDGYLEITFSLSAATNGEIVEIKTNQFHEQTSLEHPEVSVNTQHKQNY